MITDAGLRSTIRRIAAASSVAFIIVAGGLSLAGTYTIFVEFWGRTAAQILTPITGVIGASLFWPAWSTLREWYGIPRLDTCRRELLQSMAALPATSDGVMLSDCLVDLCGRVLAGRPLALLLPEARGERFVVASVGGRNAGDLRHLSLPRRSALARALERDGEPLVVTRWIEGPDGGDIPGESDTVIPLHARSRLVGVLVIGRDAKGRGLTREESAIVQELCAQAAGVLENAQLYSSLRVAFTELETAQRELLALQRATTAAQSSLNLQEVLRNICNGVVESMDFGEAIVYLVDPATKAITPASAAGRMLVPRIRARGGEPRQLRLDHNRPATRALVRHEVTIDLNPTDSILPYLVEGDALERRGALQQRTVVNVPLVANGEAVGGMALLTDRQTLTDREIDSLRGFGAQAAAAIVNARLYEDLRDAYNDLRVAQDELVRTERLRSLGELASSVAHDFNNILLSVLTHAQLLKRNTEEPGLRHSLGVIEQAAQDGAEVVRRVQNLARTKPPETREPVDLNVLVRQSIEIAQPVWKAAAEARGAEISAHLELGDPSRVTGTPSELREVFVNLMLNAVHAMPEGGSLSLRTYVKDGHAWTDVRDTGVGMSPEVKRRVFEPFFTTKGSAGSGLGMSIVASIVQRHSGIIEIDTAVGQGTTISVGFPLTLAAEARRPVPSARRVQVRKAERILVIDDNERAREALTLTLQELGHTVHACSDAHEALQLFLDGDFGIVFTDLSLDGFSGWEVARAVKKMRASAEVVLVTGWTADIDDSDPTERGVDVVLSKPFTLEEVAAALERPRLRAVGRKRPASA